MCGFRIPRVACASQKFAAHYASCAFLKVFGNANENTKYLFRDRLQTPLTPTFSFWRRGARVSGPASQAFWPVAHQGVLVACAHAF